MLGLTCLRIHNSSKRGHYRTTEILTKAWCKEAKITCAVSDNNKMDITTKIKHRFSKAHNRYPTVHN